MIKGHIETIKKVNRKLILKTIRQKQPISRSAIAKTLSLSRSTVSSIVNELVDKEFLVELGHADSTKDGGRRAIQLGINATSGYIIGLDIKEKSINGCLTDLAGTVVVERTIELENTVTEQIIANFTLSLLDDVESASKKLIAISCSVPGMVDSLKGVVIDAPELAWENVPLYDWLRNHFNCAIYINNNVNCLAMTEKWSGKAIDCKNYVYIYIGKGIGAAIMSNGHLITGETFTAGEIGYFTYPDDQIEEKAADTSFGAFDKKASILAFPKESRDIVQFSTYEQLSDLEKNTLYNILHHLGFTIGNIISLLNPEKIIIGGSLKGLIHTKKDVLNDKICQVTPNNYELNFSELDHISGAFGSVSIALDQIPDLI